jgi:hypothetical protein
MLILRDDSVIETFASPDSPPTWIEAIDVENGEYEFCDDRGQKYIGKILKGEGFRAVDDLELVPDGPADMAHALKMIEEAVDIESGNNFSDLEALRTHISKE